VTNITPVITLSDGLTEAAMEAAQKITFQPAQKDGRAVSQWVQIEYVFTLFGRKGDPDLQSDAEITEQPAAKYTKQAREKGITGKVVLDVVLDMTGKAYVFRVISGLPEGLTEEAVKAVQKIKFKTAIDKSGKPATQAQMVEYEFKLP
jgi:TonB family protein